MKRIQILEIGLQIVGLGLVAIFGSWPIGLGMVLYCLGNDMATIRIMNASLGKALSQLFKDLIK